MSLPVPIATHNRDLDRLYALLAELDHRVGGYRCLHDCDGRMNWPARGVYFFFENGERRWWSQSRRLVRIGTHALKVGSKTTLWGRLRQHKGTVGGERAGGGNRNGSVFRYHVGAAKIQATGAESHLYRLWISNRIDRPTRAALHTIETSVSRHIGAMPFLWLRVGDPPGPDSHRGYLERNIIGLVTRGYSSGVEEEPSPDWLGRHSPNETISQSGLWNVNHVGEGYDPSSLDLLEEYVLSM